MARRGKGALKNKIHIQKAKIIRTGSQAAANTHDPLLLEEEEAIPYPRLTLYMVLKYMYIYLDLDGKC